MLASGTLPTNFQTGEIVTQSVNFPWAGPITASEFDGDPIEWYTYGGPTTRYNPGGGISYSQPETWPVEKGIFRFSGTSAASPLIAGFVAGYMQLHPDANANDVKKWLYANSNNMMFTGSREAYSKDRNPFDGWFSIMYIPGLTPENQFPANTNGVNDPYRAFMFISGSVNYRQKYGVVNYSPFTTASTFIYPYASHSAMPPGGDLLKMRNVNIKFK